MPVLLRFCAHPQFVDGFEQKHTTASILALRECHLNAKNIPSNHLEVITNLNFIFYSFINFHLLDRNLGCQPAILDARDFSPQLRRRYFWGNLPGLLTLPEVEMDDQEGGRKISLSQALIPNLGRRAAQFHVRTLTTNTNSLLQGRTENCRSKKDRKKLFPVRLGDDPKKNSSVTYFKKWNKCLEFLNNFVIIFREKKRKMMREMEMCCGYRRSSRFLVSRSTILTLEISPAQTGRNYWVTLGPFPSSLTFSLRLRSIPITKILFYLSNIWGKWLRVLCCSFFFM